MNNNNDFNNYLNRYLSFDKDNIKEKNKLEIDLFSILSDDENLENIEKKINELLKLYDSTNDIKKKYNIENKINTIEYILKKYEKKRKKDIKLQYILPEQTKKNFYPYPKNFSTNFLKNLLKKKEFIINKVNSYDNNDDNELTKEMFILNNNQQFIKKLISPETPYKTIYLFHGVGVGKTCSSIQIAENFKDYYSKPPLIISPKYLRNTFRKEIFDISKLSNDNMEQCLGNYYLEKGNYLNNGKLIKINKNEMNKNIKNLINKDYEFLGYQKFSNNVNSIIDKSPNNKVAINNIRKIFDNRVIIIDEIHNMRTTGSKELHYVLKNIKNSILILLSATPMYDRFEEIIFIFNTLLINNKLPIIDDKTSIFNKNDEITIDFKNKIKKVSNNFISYMRGENPYTFPIRLYPSINNNKNILKENNYPVIDMNTNEKIPKDQQIKYLEVIYTKMSNLQQNFYNLIETTEDDIDYNPDEKPDQQRRGQISNIIYPTQNIYDKKDNIILSKLGDIKNIYGKGGLYKIFNRINPQNNNKFELEYLDNNNQILNKNNIVKYSPKINLLLENIEKSEGLILIYSKYLSSGIIPIAIALEHLGYSKYDSNNILKNNNTIKNNKNYIIISGDISLTGTYNKRNINLDTFTDIKNKNGDIIKIILITESGSEGLDLKNIREIHIFEPWHNLNRIEQVIGRGVRNLSHINLDEKKRNTTIYQYVNLNNNNRESIDYRMYRKAENKQIKISKILKFIKENSIDCNLNINNLIINNIQEKNITTSIGEEIKKYNLNDKPYTRGCDYEKCNFKCNKEIDFKKLIENNKVDISTYNKDILRYDIMYMIKLLKKFYTKKNNATLENILHALNVKYNEILYFALDDMTQNKILFHGFNNKLGYLIYRSNYYIFQPYDIKDNKILLNERYQKKIQKPLKINITNIELNKKKIENKIDIINYNKILDDKIDEYISNLKLNKDEIDKYTKYIYDIYIDSLNKKNLLILFEIFLKNKLNENHYNYIINSFTRGLYLLDKTLVDDKIILYNYFDKDLLCLTNGKVESCGISFQNKYKTILKEKINILSIKLKNNPNLPYSFIEIKGNNNKYKIKNFDIKNEKIIENKLISGTVCDKSSQNLDKNKLIKLITLVDNNKLLKKHNYKRDDLCLLYQLILKNLTNETKLKYFLRPIEYNSL